MPYLLQLQIPQDAASTFTLVAMGMALSKWQPATEHMYTHLQQRKHPSVWCST